MTIDAHWAAEALGDVHTAEGEFVTERLDHWAATTQAGSAEEARLAAPVPHEPSGAPSSWSAVAFWSTSR